MTLLPASPASIERAAREVARAWATVPFYQRRGRAPGSLADAPLLWKRDVQASLPKAWFPAGLDARALLSSGEVTLTETAGTTGERARVLWRRGAEASLEREILALRAASGERAGGGARAEAGAGPRAEGRPAVLGAPSKGMGSCHSGDPSYEDRLEDGLLHLNSRQDPTFWTDLVKDRMLDELARHETDRLVADPAYLADLADHAAASGRRLAVTGFVALTWSTTTPAHLASLARVHAGPVFQLYGTRELGATLVEAEAGRFASLPDRVLLEALPARPGVDAGLESGAEGALGLLVATTLDREIMPLVRWVTGDLVRVRDGVIVALLGRIQDAIVRPDGAWLTPADLARALGDLPFQANQRAPNEVELDVVGRHGARARSLVEGLFVGMDLDVREQSALPAEPSGRFRAARRHVPAPMARAFEGCEEGISS